MLFGCATVALNGLEASHFVVALTLLGIAWNFTYTGATTLLTQAYRPAERMRVQGFNDMIVFVTMITSSAASGVLLNSDGWALLNYVALPIVTVVVLAISWLGLRRLPVAVTR